MTRAIADLITVPAQARLQIGELASYLERALTNVKAVRNPAAGPATSAQGLADERLRELTP